MENQIFEIKNISYKSLVVRGEELWLSIRKKNDLYDFEYAVEKTGIFKGSYAYPLSSIYKISFNEASDFIKIRLHRGWFWETKLKIGFDSTIRSNNFGHFLGKKIGLTKSQKQEKQIIPLLFNLFYILLSVGGTYIFASVADTSEISMGVSKRSKGIFGALKLVADTIGQVGVIIMGSLIVAYFCYQLYQRFTNPANEIIYQ